MIGPREAFGAIQRRLAILRRAVLTEVEDINRLIYHVLRGGLVVSLAFIVFAFVLSAFGGGALPQQSIPPRDLVGELRRFSPAGLMNLGVFLLIMTPVARVFLSLVSYAEERDLTYVVITGVVLANLLVGFAFGVA